MPGEYYRIGVAIALKSNGSQVLGVLGREMLGLNVRAKQLEGGLNRIKIAAIGLGGVMAGTAVLGGMAKLVEHGKEFVHQQSLMAQAGVSQVDIANATAAAWKNASAVLNAGASDNLKLIADLRNEFGRMSEAVAASGAFTRLGVVLGATTGGDPEKAGYTASRFLDLRGSLVDPKTGQISVSRAEQQANLIEAISAATRTRVGPDELLNFQKQARGAGANLSDQGLISIVPAIQAMGGYRTGTALVSMMQEIVGGRLTQQSAKFLESIGVLDPKKVKIGRGGQMRIAAGGVKDAELLASDPVKYIDTVLRAGLVKMGATTPAEQSVLLMRDGLRQTVNGLITEVIRNAVPFSRDTANIAQAATVSQYDVAVRTDPVLRMQSFTTAWNNLLTALGAPIVGDAAGGIVKLTAGLNSLTAVVSAHPRAVRDLEVLTAGLAGVVTLSGGLAIAGAALGPFVTGMRLLTGVLVGTELAAGVALLGPLASGLVLVAGGLGAVYAAVKFLPGLIDSAKAHSVPVPGARSPAAPPSAFDFAHPFAPPSIHKQSYDAPAGGGTYHFTMPIYLDGKQIGQHTATHLIRDLETSTMKSGSAWDPRSTMLPPGMVTA